MIDPALIRIRPTTDADAALWHLTREIAEILHSLPWVLVGGQMVAILEAEHGAAIGFSTGDVDALVDVRAMTDVTLEATAGCSTRGSSPTAAARAATASSAKAQSSMFWPRTTSAPEPSSGPSRPIRLCRSAEGPRRWLVHASWLSTAAMAGSPSAFLRWRERSPSRLEPPPRHMTTGRSTSETSLASWPSFLMSSRSEPS